MTGAIRPFRSLLPWLALAVLIAPAVLAAQPAELLSRPRNFERSRDYDVLHYRLVLVLDDKEKSYLGEDTITLTSLKDGLEELVFDAENLEAMGAARLDGCPLPLSLGGGKLRVRPHRPLDYGETTSVVIKFRQRNPKTGLRFIDAAPDHPAQVNTYSWPEDAHRWFPCFDYPNDKATSEVVVTVRGDWKVLSNGRLVKVTEDRAAGTRTWHWSQEQAHPVYGIMLAAGPFEVIQDARGPLPVSYWVYPKDAAAAPRSFRKTTRMIDFYGQAFGFAYPWAKYDQVCVAGYGGGMEATTATMLEQDTIHDARADQDFPSDWLVAHELAHMWWGDLVTERAWPDVWLSESFATYSEYLFSLFDRGEDEGALNLEAKKDAYLEEARERYIRPIVFDRYTDPWQIMDGHSYPKGAAVLHMLRFVMGDKPFFRTLAEFLSRFAFKNADTHDFMNVVRETGGENLDWFFDQWLYRPGHPVFEVASTWDAGAGKLRLRISQVQDFAKGIPVFRTPVVIGVRTASQSVRHRVWLGGKEETFEFESRDKPLLVRFDEGNRLLKELVFKKPEEELVFGLQNDDAVGRIWAARELGKAGAGLPARQALERSARGDACSAVRQAALETRAALSGPGLEPFLKEALKDADSKVRAAAVKGLSGMKSPRLAPLFEDVFKNDSSYIVQAEALKGIGESGGRDRVPFLRQAAAMPSPRNILQRSAEEAIRKIEGGPGR